jgi:hypothetical protein
MDVYMGKDKQYKAQRLDSYTCYSDRTYYESGKVRSQIVYGQFLLLSSLI